MARLHTAAFCLLLACCLLAANVSAVALGCFRVSKVASPVKKASPAACQASCAAAKMPIFAHDWTNGCRCTADVPSLSARIATALCTRRQAATATLYYVHNVPGSTCGLDPKPLSPQYWAAADPSLVAFQGRDQATLSTRGVSGALLTLKGGQRRYGYFTFNVKVAGPQGGPVTAAYWTSDNSGTDRSNFDEIDVEFINFRNNVNRPGCLWIHHYKNGASGTETEICPAEAQRLTRLPYLPQPCTAAHTYGLDWQPTYMRWYIDGRLVHSRDFKDSSQVPSKPMYLKLSTWAWNKADSCNFFGGCTFDGGARYQSIFRSVSIITCKF